MRLNRFIAVIAAVLMVGAFGVQAQNVNATLTGTVTMDGNPLPGVTVTISSPNMQGTRSTTSDVNGNYNFGAIPAGTYKVVFEMQGMQNATRNVQIGVGQTGRADAIMRLTAVAEAITVTASAPAVLETTEISSNMQQSTINKLPTSRTVTGVALLAPGTTSSGPRAALVISGATADQNLITVDGAVIQENLRGQTHGLFIEDAIQETTVMTGGISAEYGRFTGGVVNSITKSGGNEFHATYRDNIDKPKWTQVTPFPGDIRGGNITNQVHEATFGGRIIRDRLWFFAAGRKTKSGTPSPFALAGGGVSQFNVQTDAKRWEGKLTGQITPKHSLVATYLDSPLSATNNCQLGCLEQAGLDPSITQGNNFYTGHYNGILTNNWLVEALYSRKTFQFIGFGGVGKDPILNSPLLAVTPAGAIVGVANNAYFCGDCGNEKRNNNSWNAKSTYFWSTKGLGTHNLIAGYERWSESRFSNNYQSPTNFVLVNYSAHRGTDGIVRFNLTPDVDYVEYFPILTPSLGSDLRTKSVFVNDKWDFNTHWNFNVGLRHDANDAVNSLHQSTSKDSNWSPRLGLNYDVLGNGKYRITGGYNIYVGRLAEAVTGASSPAGSPAEFDYVYEGPAINDLTAANFSKNFFNWFNSVGGINNQSLIVFQNIPGSQVQLRGSLKSPNVREWTVGGGMQIGAGFIRMDYIDRDWRDFYVNITNLGTGKVTVNGSPADLTLIQNTDALSRTYKALQGQFQYRLFSNLQLGTNYTYSKLRGNAVQENAGSGPISEAGFIFTYPEYNSFTQNNPVGKLTSDQTHKLRAWASYDLHTFIGNLNLSAIERYESGVPYSGTGTIDDRFSANFYGTGKPGGIVNPGYATPPSAVTYFFTERGAFHTAALQATDVSATFSVPFRGAEAYVEGYVFNATNQHKVVNTLNGASAVIVTGVRTHRTANSGLTRFNPFTDTPKQCPTGAAAADCLAMGANWQYPTTFGTATNKAAYQNPRSYSMALGLRF
jgi:hypothetical protein